MKSDLDFSSAQDAPAPRFVRCIFAGRATKEGKAPKEYTYRVEPGVEIKVGETVFTRRNHSKVQIVALDIEPVPGLAFSQYDFVDPSPPESRPVNTQIGLAGYSNEEELKAKQ